jgi:ubiquinone/menaquinone biosynthesis C-methylase UbiE
LEEVVTVLDLGAGSGRLAHWVNKRMTGQRIQVVAVDDASWNIQDALPEIKHMK